jgi:hypothetical protein
MSRIGSFRRVVDNTIEDAKRGSDTIARWKNNEGVTVQIFVSEYPHYEESQTISGVEKVRVAEYWISVDGSESHDGAGDEAPFHGIHGNLDDAKSAASEVMREISATNGPGDC